MTERVGSAARPGGETSAWIDRLRDHWSGELQDERQRAVWNQASAGALSLVLTLGWVASIAFLLIDYRRFVPCVVVFFVISLGGLLFAQAVARRQGVRPRVRVPSWRGTAGMTILFGALFFLLTLASDGGRNWPQHAIVSAVAAVAWGVLMRYVLRFKRERALRAGQDAAEDRAER